MRNNLVILLLIMSIGTLTGMNDVKTKNTNTLRRRTESQKKIHRRTASAPSLFVRQTSFEQGNVKHASDHGPSLQHSNISGTESNVYNSATASDDSNSTAYAYSSDSADELDRLGQLTSDLDADPSATLRNTDALSTHEATPDDLARLIQFHSRASIFEARMLNVQSREKLCTLLNERAEIMAQLLGDGISGVDANLRNLDTRLQAVQALLPRVQELLAREDLLCQQYEGTCTRLAMAFATYANEVGAKEIELIALVKALKAQQDKIKERIDRIDQRTVDINNETHQTFGTVRLNLWMDRFMRNACSITTTLGVAALIVYCFCGGRHTAAAIDTNPSLQKIL